MKRSLICLTITVAIIGFTSPISNGKNLVLATEQKDLQTLDGKVIHQPWSKTLASWMAGGSDYFILDTGEQSIILKTTDQVTEEMLATYQQKRVKIQGIYLLPQPSHPEPFSQYPTDINGAPLPTGGGFAVYEIEAIR